MKPAAFDYVRAESLGEALDVLHHGGSDARVIAGGQSLLPMLNMRLAKPGAIVDINRIKELAYINDTPDGLMIGTLTRQRAVERSRVEIGRASCRERVLRLV